MRARGWFVVAAVVAGTGLAGAGIAAGASAGIDSAGAQPSAPVTVTLSPEQVQRLCETRLPRIEERISRLTTRIGGGPEVRGSSAWLNERAARERAEGREAAAKALEERAQRRSGRVDDLDRVERRVAEFRGKHCGTK